MLVSMTRKHVESFHPYLGGTKCSTTGATQIYRTRYVLKDKDMLPSARGVRKGYFVRAQKARKDVLRKARAIFRGPLTLDRDLHVCVICYGLRKSFVSNHVLAKVHGMAKGDDDESLLELPFFKEFVFEDARAANEHLASAHNLDAKKCSGVYIGKRFGIILAVAGLV